MIRPLSTIDLPYPFRVRSSGWFFKPSAWRKRNKMTVDREVIFCIAIAFAVVHSAYSDVKGDTNAICSKMVRVTESRNISYREHWYSIFPSYGTENYTMWRLKLYCCNGYKLDNKTCNPQCSSTCNNGYCAQPNICKCDSGWGGDFCDKLHSCFIRLDITEATSEHPVPNSVQNKSENSLIEQMTVPECLSKCRDYLDSTASNMTQFAADHVKYFLPIESACNIPEASAVSRKIYVGSIGAILGIALCIVVTACAVYLVKRKRMWRNKISDQQKQPVYTDHMVENAIYS